ncbi:MAG: NADAR family protein [Roseibium sp.]|uniref:NADAR family protein n=1 Tax=Roseibium sp. TaxID=1936156 RepID=UPI0032995EB7
MPFDPGVRQYKADEVAGFRKTAEAHGGFSNMASGLPIKIGDTLLGSSEAFYQAMRFPDAPAAQQAILDEKSPMMAKRTAYRFIDQTRDDWLDVNVAIMRHALKLKLCMNREPVLDLYRAAGDKPIVEISHKDAWWGAKPVADGMLEGCNVLGRLLMEQRQALEIDPDHCLDGVAPPDIPNYRLLEEEVGFVSAPDDPLAAYQTAFSL